MRSFVRAIAEGPLLAKAAPAEGHLRFAFEDLAVFVGDLKVALDHQWPVRAQGDFCVVFFVVEELLHIVVLHVM